MEKYILQAILVSMGTVSLLAAVMNWEWFFSAMNAQVAVKMMSRRNARLWYGFGGIVAILVALLVV
jgi:hypothetical protein